MADIHLDNAAQRLDNIDSHLQRLNITEVVHNELKNVNLNNTVNNLQAIENTLSDDDICLLELACERLSKNWPAQHGHRVMHAISKLSGKPIPYGISDIPHRLMFSLHNSYAPWAQETHLSPVLRDILPAFYEVTECSKYTLVDIYRFWTIYEALYSIKSIKGDVLEVGVYRGGTAAFIAHILKHFCSPSHFYLCDTFSGVVKATQNDTAYKGGEHADTNVQCVEKLISKYLAHANFTILQGIFPEETAGMIQSNVFKFCHIDVDTYQSAADVFSYILPKMKENGIVIFDDYATQGLEGMTRFCNELKHRNDLITFHMFNGQFMVIKISS